MREVPLAQLMRAAGIRREVRIRRTLPRVRDETTLRRTYRDELVNIWQRAIRTIISQYTVPTDGALQDADGRELQWLAEQAEQAVNSRRVYQTQGLQRWVTGAGNANTRAVAAGIKAATTIDVSGYFVLGDIRTRLEVAIAENVDLITRLNIDTKSRVSQILFNGFTQRKSKAQISRELQHALGITRRHADFIVKDQNHKLNAALTELRHEQSGIKGYIWTTMRDDRVRGNPDGRYPNARPSHWAREGKRYWYSRPPEGGHPGEAIGCRCIAEAYIDPRRRT